MAKPKIYYMNDIAYWFPKLLLSEQPVPRTIIIPPHTNINYFEMLEGITPAGLDIFKAQMLHAISIVGHPAFIRTGYTSGKHNAKMTCMLERPSKLSAHIYSLVLETATHDLSFGNWAVRERLPFGDPYAFIAFNGLPIRRERRYFFRDGKVEYHLPYWPSAVFEAPRYFGVGLPDNWKHLLKGVNRQHANEIEELTTRTEQVAEHFDGWWSVDWIHTARGWVAIDMARGEDSWGREYNKNHNE